MKARLFLAWVIMLLSGASAAAEGDIDLVFNVYTKHTDSTYFDSEFGETKFFEGTKNDVMGIRLGLTDNFNLGYARGYNSYGARTNVYASEFTYSENPHVEIGVMAGLADGYDKVSSSGWAFIGGPFIRGKTPFGGASLGLYGFKAIVVNIEVPLNSSFWH